MKNQDKPAKPISRERMLANHLGITVSEYRSARAMANKLKRVSLIQNVRALKALDYSNKTIAQVMEITESSVRNILK